jgi:1-acyl-sn-glycerol-3-phosphate acyltransferase
LIQDRLTDKAPLARLSNANRPPTQSLYGVAFEHFCKLFLTHYCRLEVRGTLSATASPFLICSNHRSHLDSLAILIATGLPFTSCGLLAAQDYFFRNPIWLRLLTPAMHLIPVSRRPRPHEFQSMVDSCAAFLRDGGRALIAYPEGTRSNAAGLSTFKRGAAVLALRLGLPVLPIFVSGTDRVLPKQRIIPRPGRIIVHIGPLLHFNQGAQPADLRSHSLQAAKEIEACVSALNSRP